MIIITNNSIKYKKLMWFWFDYLNQEHLLNELNYLDEHTFYFYTDYLISTMSKNEKAFFKLR